MSALFLIVPSTNLHIQCLCFTALPTPRSPGRPVGNSDPEREAEDLVAWTQNLNPADLDF